MRGVSALGRVWFGFVLSIVPAFVFCGSSHAHDAEQASGCASIEEDLARLACYDAAFGRANVRKDVVATSKVPPVNTPEPAPAAASEVVDAAVVFGAEDLPRDRTEPKPGIDSLEARVVEVRPDSRGKHVILLDNGQTWRQVESTDAVPVRVGDTVRIRRGAFDSYRLRRTSGGRTVTVRRTS